MKKLEYADYAITEDGQVWSFKTNKFIKSHLSGSGYFNVTLRIDGRTVSKQVHRLVAETFIPNPECKIQVNHKDCDKLNNRVSNLEWCTGKENMKHASKNGRLVGNRNPPDKPFLSGEEHYRTNLTEEVVSQIREDYKTMQSYKKVGEKYGLSETGARNIITRRTWKHI